MYGDHVIEARELSRVYNGKRVVDNVSFRVPRGCVFGFLGRNGSGKTTTIRMLLGLTSPSAGSSTLLGENSRALSESTRARVGYITEEHRVVSWMTVAENGAFQAAFYPRWSEKLFRSVTEHFRLKEGTRAADLSRGERAGLALALTLAPEPELVIMDDPALGLDPVARRALVESMLYITRAQDRTIFFSTHLLSDVERVADHIAILDQSVLRACCPLEVFRDRVRCYAATFGGEAPSVSGMRGLLQSSRNGRSVRVTCVETGSEVRQELERRGALEVELMPLGLEDAFVSYLEERGEKRPLLGLGESLQPMEVA